VIEIVKVLPLQQVPRIMFSAKNGGIDGSMEDQNQTGDQSSWTFRDETEDEHREAVADHKYDRVTESIYPGMSSPRTPETNLTEMLLRKSVS
jgi:hypothetical protein